MAFIEESERESQDTLGQHQYETFESWDSEQRKAYPTAMIVTLTIEAPQLTYVEEERGQDRPNRKTFVRIIPLVQADDIEPPSTTTTTSPNTNQNPGTGR